MINEVVLHIGMHKTGTTAIQYCLENFDDGATRMARLNDVNHSVPIYSLFSQRSYHYFMHQSLGRSKSDIDEYNREAILTLENELALDREQLIISGEDISLLDREEVFELISFLKARATTVRIIAYIRDPEEFASSALQQYIQGGMRKAQLPTPEYKRRFSAFIDSAADSVDFIDYRKNQLHKNCVLQDFCQLIALNSTELIYDSQNTSISLECAQLLYHFNQFGLPSFGNPSLRDSRKLFILNLARNINTTKFQLPQALVWTQKNLEDSQWMENASGIKLLPIEVIKINTLEPETVDSHLHELLSSIDTPTLASLQAIVSSIDKEIGKDCRVNNLLNFLFSQHYFVHTRPQVRRLRRRRRLRRLLWQYHKQRRWRFKIRMLLSNKAIPFKKLMNKYIATKTNH